MNIQINIYTCCDDQPGRTPTTPGTPAAGVAATALGFRIQILMENLDTRTHLEVVLRSGEEVVADETVMSGEKPEFYAANVVMQLDRNVDLAAENLTFEMIHPGIPSNEQPHVRLQVLNFAYHMSDGTKRGASVNMEQADNFTDKHHETYPPGHLNFVDGDRSSGRLNIVES